MNYKPKNILVTGAAGFIGSNYVRMMLSRYNDVEVIELQHGTFSKYHLGYSFPNRKEPLEYFPDKFYVWNDFWRKIIKLPIDEKDVVVDSFRYMQKMRVRLCEKISKNNNQLVVLSQGVIGGLIAEKLLDNLDYFKNFDIKYKLHPGEFDRWKSYEALVKLNKFDNVKIIKDEIHLYELLAESCIQVGVFSTAIYEGVEFGCKTILLNLPGIEYMDRFVELNNIEKIF